MSELIAILGVFLAVEGALYAGAPGFAKSLALRVLDMSEESLRRGGLISLVAGVALVWLVKG